MSRTSRELHDLRFSRADAARAPLEPGRRSALIFERGTVEVRYYAPRQPDRQRPHDRDELYVIESGSGTFARGDERTPFVPGDMLFVPAGVVHQFEDFSDDLEAWVIFFGPELTRQ
jgi:mannose-6-phosphate isomerase-like protein (cupin superfamily)